MFYFLPSIFTLLHLLFKSISDAVQKSISVATKFLFFPFNLLKLSEMLHKTESIKKILLLLKKIIFDAVTFLLY